MRFGVSYPPIEEIVSQIAKREKANMPAILADVERDRRFDADLKLAPAWIEKLILECIKR